MASGAGSGQERVEAPSEAKRSRPAALGGSRARRYGLAGVASGLAFLVSWLLAPLLEPTGFPLFLAGVMASAWYGGLGPGLVATGLGAIAGSYFLVPPAYALPSPTPSVVAHVAVFLLEGTVISSLTAALGAARRRAESLFAVEQAARTEIEAAMRAIRNLQGVTDAALAHLTLDDLLRDLLRRIQEILEADTVAFLLATEDGDELLVRAALGLEREVADGVRVPVGRGIAGQIAARRGPMIFEDLEALEVWSPVLREKGIRSVLGVPLMVDERVIGVVHVGTLRPRRFTDDDVRLLGLVADRIALAVDRARLYEAERAARAAAEAAERGFRVLVDGVRDYALCLLDPEGAVIGWNAGAERLWGYGAGEILGAPFARFFTADAERLGAPERALAGAQASGQFEEERWEVRRDGSRFWAEVVVTALRSEEGALLGFSVLTRDLTERKRAEEIRTRLLEQVISAREEEQRRVARELHDGAGQSLTSLLVGLRAIREAPVLAVAQARADDLRQTAARALDEIRHVARGLRPSVLDDLGLVPALEQYATEFGRAHGLAIDVEARGIGAERLPGQVETALYRIVQEALTNAAKHAKAQTVSIVVRRSGERVQAIVTDDGSGFDVTVALTAPGVWTHLGLHGMRERAALLGGSVTIESTLGAGTTVYVWLPLRGGALGKDPDPDRG